MIRPIVAQLRGRLGRTLGLAAGLLVAALAFTVLTGAASTSQLRTVGLVRANDRSAYDILVRPPASQTRIERARGLVRANYLSGIFGGITLQQYHEISRLPGVQVAAPIANIGYVMPFVNVPVDVTDLLTKARRQVFRVRLSWTTDRGLSRYSDADTYIYVTRQPIVSNAQSSINEKGPNGRYYQVCAGFSTPGTPTSPFDLAARSALQCESTRHDPNAADRGLPAGHVGITIAWPFPMLISAIDPVPEARLDHVNTAIVGGRYLRETDRPRTSVVTPAQHGFAAVKAPVVPMIAPTRSVIDEQAHIAVQALRVRRPKHLPVELAVPSARHFLSALSGSTRARRLISAGAAFRGLLHTFQTGAGQSLDSLWRVGPVTYQRTTRPPLRPLPVSNPPTVWSSMGNASGFVDPPMSAEDRQFRHISEALGSNDITAGVTNYPWLKVVGEFDPAKLPGFSRLSRVPMETYNPPQASGADARSRALLKNRPLLPNGDPGGYLEQPPLLLTTLAALPEFTNPANFAGQDAAARRVRRAPISVVRIRVAGVRGVDPLSRARVNAVADEIHVATGLTVDITIGSSPTHVDVALPAGRYGRPPLRLAENWTKKGVAVAIVSAVDRKSLLLFALILVVCALFVFNAATAAVRARRVELGVLSCFGWPARTIFMLACGELAVVGALAGLAATALTLPTAIALHIHLQPLRLLLVTPVAVLLALVAGAVPASSAAHARPADGVRPPVSDARRARHHRLLIGIALANLARRPGRAFLPALGLAVGVAGLTVLIGITQNFHGQIVGTMLGNAVTVRVRGVDYIAVTTTLILAAASLTDTLYLNLRERAAEFATLRAVGWSHRRLLNLLAWEALTIGAVGGLTGAVAGLAALAELTGAASRAVPETVAAGAGGITVAALAAMAVSGALSKLPITELLAAD